MAAVNSCRVCASVSVTLSNFAVKPHCSSTAIYFVSFTLHCLRVELVVKQLVCGAG
jgi:hypothetical protein